ncbi:MAG: hypothetical protein QF632_00530 [Candidatus Woesearchaeota archaeon]|jgi:ribosomal protein S3AE|nr:hypothetical protein [Candidatus Woesearchaeota archaeon]MDP7458339.1 hypothetical protein [Candidatus Woesearchaeota archaeon]
MAKSTASKVKKKTWYQIVDSGMFGKAVLGETYVENPEQIVGKTVSINMMDLTRDPKKQNTIIKFVISDMKGDKAQASVIGLGLNSSSIKRLMRRGKARVDLSNVYKTKDGKHVRVKPFIVTRVPSYKSTLSDIRRTVHNFFLDTMEKLTYQDFVNTLVEYRLQRTLRGHLEKIIPLSACEVRDMRIVTLRKDGEKQAVEDVIREDQKVAKAKAAKEKRDAKKAVKVEKKEAPKEEKKEVQEEKKEVPVKEEKVEKKEEKKEESAVKDVKEVKEVKTEAVAPESS